MGHGAGGRGAVAAKHFLKALQEINSCQEESWRAMQFHDITGYTQ